RGVWVLSGAGGNTIGGPATGPGGIAAPGAPGNLISGNLTGVQIEGTGTSGNIVAGNLIGTDASGVTLWGGDGAFLGNSTYGVQIQNGASGNQVGGASYVDPASGALA